MIIGIIEADELDTEVLRLFGSYTERFAQLLSTAESRLVFQTYRVMQREYPENIDACDAYLITGSKYSCYDEAEWIEQLKQFVVDCYRHKKKLIGICFGHQLIAQALGGWVQRSDKGWGVGLTRSHVTDSPDWLSPQQAQFNLLVNHQDQIVRLPERASLIATNAFCPVAGYQVNQTALGFQGHPEFNREYLQHLMTKNRETIGELVFQQAEASLQDNIDQDLVAQWIVNFIRG